MTFPAPGRSGDDSGSLLMAMLVSMIGLSMAALLAPIVITQIGTTRVDLRRVHTAHAAQAGLDATMAQIRAAVDGKGNGVRASLPCGPLSGDVGGGTTEHYQVSIYYVGFDPQRQMSDDQTWFAANDLACTPGSGPSALPRFAVAFSTGTDAGASRMLRGAYRLRTSNQNIAGGRIHIFRTAASTVDLCMDTGTTVNPTAGTTLKMRICDTGRPEQIFAYTPDLTLLLVNSVTAAQPDGMCLDAGKPQKEGALVTFQPCEPAVAAYQQWRYNSNAMFEGASSGWVFEMLTADSPGSLVKITKSAVWDGNYNNHNSFSPEAAVGPGDAGPANNQIVNFDQFGRCLDLDGGNYAIGHLIAWPCKPSWNQTYGFPPLNTSLAAATAGKITMDVPAGKATPKGLYCLKSPRSTALKTYPSMTACKANSTAPELQWTMFGYTGNYATSYRIFDVDGNCLQPNDPNAIPPDTEDNGAEKISKIVMRPCDESTTQKWNADPNILAGLPLKYLGED